MSQKIFHKCSPQISFADLEQGPSHAEPPTSPRGIPGHNNFFPVIPCDMKLHFSNLLTKLLLIEIGLLATGLPMWWMCRCHWCSSSWWRRWCQNGFACNNLVCQCHHEGGWWRSWCTPRRQVMIKEVITSYLVNI